MAGLREPLSPLRPRREGAVLDGAACVSTLVISARDDPLAPYRFAAAAAPRIPGARLWRSRRGGHLFLGQDAEVREEISAFVVSAGPSEASP
jgi:pimeloyl-ACP methyl ester carboxylesterase